MEEKTFNKIKELTEQINKLPKGYISAKNIGNSVIANIFQMKTF